MSPRTLKIQYYVLQIIIGFYGSIAVGAGINESVKGWKANEEKYLQTNLNWEKWLEEEKQTKNEIETIQRRRSEWKKCCCEDARSEEQFVKNFLFLNCIYKYTHWKKNWVP